MTPFQRYYVIAASLATIALLIWAFCHEDERDVVRRVGWYTG